MNSLKAALVQFLRSPFSVLRSPFSVLRSPFSVSLICVPALLLAGTLEVRAATITIDKAETQTNGGQTLTSTGGDTITVTKDGSITTNGDGINARGGNTITNSGSISTEGSQAEGIRALDDNTITNSGSINTNGRSAEGIWAVNDNKITNSGSISTESELADGIQANADSAITNSGSISTKGEDAVGIWGFSNNNTITNEAGASIRTEGENAAGIRTGFKGTTTFPRVGSILNKITNHGRIMTSGGAAAGIDVSQGGTVTNTGPITNTGLITTTGASAPGIWVLDNTKITHSGRIQVTGPGSAGIRAGNGNELTLSGSINSTQGSALHLGNNNIVNHSGNDTLRSTGQNTPAVQMGDGNTLTNTGRIEAIGRGANAHGIMGGSNNIIIHSGRIQISGPGSAGIRAGNGNELTLSGSINSARGSALHLGDNNIVNHSGNDTLRSTGQNTPAVMMGDGNTLTNTGRIEAIGQGANAHGIMGGSNNIIIHSGIIQVTGPGSVGIRAGNGNELTLSGSINSARGSALHLGDNNNVIHSGNDTLHSTGQNTPAVRLGDGNTLTNTGRIEATGRGSNAHGITGGSNNIINNSGTISARGGKAFCFTGRNNTINLLSGSVLIGGLCPDVNGRVNRVRMTVDTAPAHSILWNNITARPKRGSGAPFFYNAQSRQLATYDIRALAASAQVLGDASGNVSGLMARPGLESATRRRSLIPTASGSALWLRTFGNRARYRSRGDLNPEAGHLGLAAGYDLRLNATQFGVLAGYGRGELRFEGTQRFKPGPSLFKGPFAGLYVRRDFAPFSVQVGLSGGALKHESSRLVNDNLAPNGLARAEARTRSWWLAPEARVGLRLDAGLMQFEPAFTARYAWQSIRGFSETGIRAPATVGQRKVELLETRLELKTVREVGSGRIALKAGWQYRDDLNSNEAEVRLLGESQRVRLESGLGSSLYLGAEAEFELAPGLFLNLSGEAVSGDGYENMSGMASVYKAF